MRRFGNAPDGLSGVVIGGRDIGQALVADARVAVVSATGSTAMGRDVGPRLAARFARAILELGGNNAAIVAPSADLDLAVRAIAFAAIGTAGQRCTTLRRLFVHDNVYERLVPRLSHVYASVKVGDPREAETLVGPLIDRRAFESMQRALEEAREAGGNVYGGERIEGSAARTPITCGPRSARCRGRPVPHYAKPLRQFSTLMRYSELDEAIRSHNAVGAGLSSSIFTLDMREAERFVSTSGSDCGIANVNIGPSGAEIGGAFGGEKETGGGREAGSDAWKAYMRRATNTVNFGTQLPLAQGVRFDIGE